MTSSSPQLGASLMASVLLGKAASTGDTLTLQRLLDGVERMPRPDTSVAMASAAEHGHIDAIRILLPFYEKGHQNSMALRLAARNGSIEMFELLQPFSNAQDASSCLAEAAECGHTEIVHKLLPAYATGDNDSIALTMAARKGHLDIVRMLLPVSDAKAQKSAALCGACAGGFGQIVALLLPLSNPEDFVAAMACAVANKELDVGLMFHERCDLNAVQRLLIKQGVRDETDMVAKLMAAKQAQDLRTKTQQANGSDKTRRL
jgi:ankyrin repeat protein